MAAGAAAVSLTETGSAQPSLGTLTWVQHDGLWIRELPDGQAAKILSGNGLHHPRLSPSGRWICYADGDEKRLVVRRDGISPVSFEAATTAWLPHDALVVGREGESYVLTEADGWRSRSLSWKTEGLPLYSPKGDVYARWEIHERPADEYGLNRDKTELYIAPAGEPERKARVLIAENEGAIQLYAWTRDGASLIYWRLGEWSASAWCDGVELYSMSAAGGPERKLGVTTLAYDDMLSLSPKGNLLAVTRGSYREAWTDKRIAVVDLGTGKIRDLTEGSVSALCPAWSSDGATIAYTAAPDGGNLGGGDPAQANVFQRKLWLVDPSGGTPRPFTNDPHYRDEEPMWSADGSHLLFGRMDYNGHASLWLIERSGAGARHICPLRIQSELPNDDDSWFGYYGYINWRSAFDWRR